MSRAFYIVPLGVSSAAPMHGRHMSATLIGVDDRQILIDCGEGTQFQLQHVRFKPRKLDAILISHVHGDHWYGLPGLLSSLSLHGRRRKLTLAAPAELHRALEVIPGLGPDDLAYELRRVVVDEKATTMTVGKSKVEWLELDHPVYCVGYRITESDGEGNLDVDKARQLGINDFGDYKRLKAGHSVRTTSGHTVAPSDVIGPGESGRTFGYVMDTRPCPNAVRLAQDVDLLLHEATFLEDMQDRAIATGHSTATEAAAIARDANAHRLLLAHFSGRYKDATVVADEARKTFASTEVAEELTRYDIVKHVYTR